MAEEERKLSVDGAYRVEEWVEDPAGDRVVEPSVADVSSPSNPDDDTHEAFIPIFKKWSFTVVHIEDGWRRRDILAKRAVKVGESWKG